MEDFLVTAAFLKLGYAAIAMVGLIGLSSWLDQRAKRSFQDSLETMAREPLALATYYGLRIVALAVLVGLLIGCTSASAGPVIPSRYDREIQRATEAYWPDYPHWSAWKAQLYQESRLDPQAVSPVGARGLAQFMPGTWDEVRRELRLGALSPHHDTAIEAGAYYMAKLRRIWSAKRTPDARHVLAQASYNTGAGHVLAAQTRCGGGLEWQAIAPCLPAVTGVTAAAETTGYVTRIAGWRRLIEAGL